MPASPQLVVGIDIGTSGVRAQVVAEDGTLVSETSEQLNPAATASGANLHEQRPQAWWDALCRVTSLTIDSLGKTSYRLDQLTAVCVDGTSGTVVALDGSGNPLRPAIMYNDPRAKVEAERLNALAADFCQKLGYQFKSSYALAKILWIAENEPATFERTAQFVHQADFIAGRLRGEFGPSDYSNSLKTGYDLIDNRWPDWIDHLPGVKERLPNVVAPGTPIGAVSACAATDTGLPQGLTVVAGATDGTAGFLASGARRVGDYNTTLGTTLVFKGISQSVCRHPEGLVYCHKLPGGLWLPGAASNTGCEWIGAWFPRGDPAELDEAAKPLLPGQFVAYPLVRSGERFPFLSSSARGFFEPEPRLLVDRYAACLVGVAFVERLAYHVIEEVADTSGGEVFSTGGGSRSDIWVQCRADVTGRVLHRPGCPESAFGAAILAAAETVHGGLNSAVENMVRIERTFHPDSSKQLAYDELFQRFCGELERRGYC